MTVPNDKKRNNKILQTIALLLFLVGLPLGSWYYLQRGLDYRLDAMEELKTYGEAPDFELTTADDSLLTKGDLRGKLVVAAFLTTAEKERPDRYGEVLSKLLDQFGEGNNFKMLVHGTDTLADTPRALLRFAATHRLTDEDVCHFLPPELPAFEKLAREGYRLPLDAGTELRDNPYLALADSSLTIRNYYDITEESQVRRLVEHIAMIIPRAPERDLVFKREKEK